MNFQNRYIRQMQKAADGANAADSFVKYLFLHNRCNSWPRVAA